MFEKTALGVRDFPAGEGPPLYLSVSFAECVSLGPGQGAFVSFDGSGGAICHGLHATRAVVLVHLGATLKAPAAAGEDGPVEDGGEVGGGEDESEHEEGSEASARAKRTGREPVGAAFCMHTQAGPLDPVPFLRALEVLGRPSPGSDPIFAVIASRGDVTAQEERFFVSLGLSPDHVFTYSNCHLPQFGVSGLGQVGEAR